MAQSIVTRAFEAWNVKKVLDGQPAVPDQIVFALNPNQDENQAVSRDEGMPAAAAIKHRAAITQSGVLNTNAVVYSVVLDTAIGDWDYNWIGLVDSKTNTVLMIVHVRTQQKIKTQNGRQGNSLTRNLAMQFDGAAAATQINVSAATWQIDFSARLFGMDEAHRLAMLDYYGAAAFLNDGFRVSLANGVATVMAGIGYVGGLRAQLDAPAMLNVSANTSVWLDVSRQGTVTGAWENRIKFTAASPITRFNNYTDDAGYAHYVTKLAAIVSGQLTDNRPLSPIADLDSRFILKDQNGADIPNKPLFRENAGITALLNEKANSSTVLLLKGPIGASDLDTLAGQNYQGRWTQGDTANATIARHYPIVSAGSLDVIYNAVAGYGTVQIYTTHISNRIFVRSKPLTTDPWSDWVEVWTSANLPNPMTTDTAQTITNAKSFKSGQQPLRLLADVEGAPIFIPFFDSNGTTRKGLVGRGSANNSIQILNDVTAAGIILAPNGNINLSTSGAGIVNWNGQQVLMSGNAQTIAGIKTFTANPSIARAGFPGIEFTNSSVAANAVGRYKLLTSPTATLMQIYSRVDSETTTGQTVISIPTASTGTALVTGNNAVADANGSWVMPGSAGSVSINDLAGIPLPFPAAVAPSGWLKCNGQSFDKTLYPVLASRYPSGVLPDLRGEFVRGWDDGRGADAGRALLSAQGDAIRNITGSLFYGYDADVAIKKANSSTSAMYYDTSEKLHDTDNYMSVVDSPTMNAWYPAKLDASRVVPTANENRPRNIAFNYIVRAA
ncbi:phage tail protein [Pectobacterium aquaticum]|uniref:phage tail-collar fiber domain-containing protein n=1 Tax=Pectobacterium aquaticum TaxID=2204145 RepID=UPI000E225064|nr:phage tail protein [Pectobacterium aquaticum]UEM40085.1 phage tail protein [Pectobacterium aquaticum]